MSVPRTHSPAVRRLRQVLIGVTAVSLGLAGASSAVAHPKPGPGAPNPDLGTNVTIFDPSMPTE